MGCQYTGMDNTDSIPDMVTGLVKFLKYTAGLMIMEKMEGNSFRRQSRLERTNQNINNRLIAVCIKGSN